MKTGWDKIKHIHFVIILENNLILWIKNLTKKNIWIYHNIILLYTGNWIEIKLVRGLISKIMIYKLNIDKHATAVWYFICIVLDFST